jgi:hypothetical protein
MLVIYVLAWAIAIALMVANGIPEQEEPGFIVALGVAFTAFMVVGAVIVAHRPRNAIGWIFSAIGLLAATGMLTMEYAAYAYVTHPGSFPGAILAAWYQWWWDPMLGLILVFTPLLFPTGRLLSARWRPVAVAAALAGAAIVMLNVLQPSITLQNRNVAVRNPVGWPASSSWRTARWAPYCLRWSWCAVSQRSSRWCPDFAARKAWSVSSSSGSPLP